MRKKGLQHVSELLPAIITPEMKPLTPIQERLSVALTGEEQTVYQHSVMCQTCIPYRDPGDDVRVWKRRNGFVRIELFAGRVLDPNIDEVVDVGLPFGPKPRLALYHLNAEAMRTQSPTIELEDSLTAFVKRTLNLDVDGRTIKTVREQLNRLAAADFRFYASYEGHAVTVKGPVIDGLDIWVSKNERQRVLWPSVVQFSQRYFESLMLHAVPLNEGAVSALAHSAMALDVYTWLAQRLHRVKRPNGDFVAWSCLKDQFGQGYEAMNNFRRVFLIALKQVKQVYREARYTVDGQGMCLHTSPPPVARRTIRIK